MPASKKATAKKTATKKTATKKTATKKPQVNRTSEENVDSTAETREVRRFPSNEEQQSEHDRRQAELQAQRDEHNERVAPGGGRL